MGNKEKSPGRKDPDIQVPAYDILHSGFNHFGFLACFILCDPNFFAGQQKCAMFSCFVLLGCSLMNVEKLMKMASSVRTGGKGTMRRKKKAVHKTTTTDDKRLQSTLKRIGVNAIPAIEEVNIFKEDVVIQFINPKVQASIAANTWVVSGSPQTKKLQDILPQIIHQLGPDNLENLKKLAEQFQKQVPAAGAGAAAGSTVAPEDADDDEVPDLVPGETFEAAAEEGNTHTS
ncbi:Nascent polypeptide-associated complex subunit beta [Sesamum angolense]|uniref:Nascent polypeptide-associated complex subunit beta n=1 Tax=Sesamum angolense TaxID=2727404 RepID=A0AAE1T878_9LAMI|nr:Nascent polypeptide-associated complex subunit beta [Sesamum angolense]